MHINFGVVNDKLSNVLAINESKYAIARSYAKCDFEYYHNYNQNDNNSPDNVYKETSLDEMEDNMSKKLSIDNMLYRNEKLSEAEVMPYAVRVHNLNFSYRKSLISNEKANKILQNCSLDVIEATIYSLLGSSGCGKTTLLKCILGRLKPTSGEVQIFGCKPNTPDSDIPGPGVGYMPQELALFGEISIEETLKYFGRLFAMSPTEINDKIHFLIELLHLPSKTKVLSKLSGGQQRRVSLSVALLHSPKLLILDEPTVGLDPLLRQRIWDYLQQLCSEERVTIMITTHYIEEARNATTVGLMRGGSLLAEDNPDLLMKRYSSQTLEDVFLKLCQFNDSGKTHEFEMKSNYKDNNDLSSDVSAYSNNTLQHKYEKLPNSPNFSYIFSWFRVWAVFCKTWNKIRGNPILFLAYFLPSVQLSIFCASIGKDPRALNIAIYNEESPPYLTQHLLNYLDNDTIIQNKYETLESATDSVIDGNSWAVISLSSNFSKCLKVRTRRGAEANNMTISCSNIKLYPDMSNAVISLNLIKSIALSFQKFVQNYLIKFGYNPNSISLPVKTQEVIYGTFDPSIQGFMAPGMVIALIFFAPFALTSLTLLDEHIYGVLERSLVAGVKPLEILSAHLLIQLCVLSIEVCLMILTTFYVWRIPNIGNLWGVTAIVFLQGVSGLTFGLFIASIVPNKISAMIIGMGVIFPTWITCGVFWPIESMPPLMKLLSYFLPLTCPIESMRFIMSRGWDLTFFPVLLGFISSFVYITIFFTGAVIVFKWFV